jgi:hypothetical protein
VAPARGWRLTAHLRNLTAHLRNHTAHLRNHTGHLRNHTGPVCTALLTGRTAVTPLDS